MGIIKLFLTDCDGCLTDGGMYYSENGDELKKFNAVDGMGFQLLQEHGILTGIVTGEKTRIVERRAKKLKVDVFIQGTKDKLSEVQKYCRKVGIKLEETAYVGDDINDVELLKSVGYPFSVNNARDEVKRIADYVSPINGGSGAIRDIIDHILANRGKEHTDA